MAPLASEGVKSTTRLAEFMTTWPKSLRPAMPLNRLSGFKVPVLPFGEEGVHRDSRPSIWPKLLMYSAPPEGFDRIVARLPVFPLGVDGV